MSKLVRAKTHDLPPRAYVGWSDVWITFTSKPNRKTNYYGPTLMSRTDLEGDIYIHRRCLEDSKLDGAKTDPEYWLKEIADGEKLLARLADEHIIVELGDRGTPEIYINKKWFNRKDAEQMIDALMKALGYRGARVKWKPVRDGYIHPMTFGDPALLDA